MNALKTILLISINNSALGESKVKISGLRLAAFPVSKVTTPRP